MALSSATSRMPNYVGNGTADTFSYTFRIITNTDLLVTVRNTTTDVETTLVLTTDYTVTGAGESAGGTVVLVNSAQAWLDADGDLNTGHELSIRRVRPLTQTTDIRNQGDFYPEAHEDAFDHVIMIEQQQQDELNRSIKLSETVDPADFDTTLPPGMVGEVSVVLITNATGDGFAVGPTAAAISGAQASATAAAASASAASTSASAASTSATAAAASAASAAAQLASAFYRDVVYKTFADSPLTIAQADNGKLFVFDSSGGAITINLPSTAAVVLPFNVAFLLKTAGNNVTINRNGTDTIMGATSKVLSAAGVGYHLTADDSASPDDWSVAEMGSVADGAVTGAAGGGKLAYSVVNAQTADTAPALADEILTADVSAAGLKKATLAKLCALSRAKNYAQNAEFRFWQRQAPGTLTARTDDQYSADRWYVLTSGGAVNVEAARVAEVISSSPTPYVAQIRQGNVTARRFGIAQILEYDQVVALRGKTVTLSFWARTDGTEVPNIRAGVVEWTSTADTVTSDIVSVWASTPTLIASAAFINTPSNLALTASMQQFTITVTLGSTFNNLVLFVWTEAEEAQNDDFYITQVQLVEYSEALPWNHIRKEYDADLRECKRFYEKSYDVDTAPGTNTIVGTIAMNNDDSAGSRSIYFHMPYHVQKRAIPTHTTINYATGAAPGVRGTDASNGSVDLPSAGTFGSHARASLNALTGGHVHFTAECEL